MCPDTGADMTSPSSNPPQQRYTVDTANPRQCPIGAPGSIGPLDHPTLPEPDAWLAGYCAALSIAVSNDADEAVREALECAGLTVERMREAGVEQPDIDTLAPFAPAEVFRG